jgi:hypothetical protein
MHDAELDTVASHWREALDAAEESLDEVSRSRRVLQFRALDLRERAKELSDERARIEVDLEKLARATRTHLHRHLYGPRPGVAMARLQAR